MVHANIPGMEDVDRAPEGVVRVRAPNPSPLTLDGTNSYVVHGWVVDPGPLIEEHFTAIERAAGPQGIRGIVITHSHFDHDEGAPRLAERAGGAPILRPTGGEQAGPFEAVATPGHSSDHVSLMWDRVCFTGDTVLGEGSVFVGAGDSSMAQYLESLRRLRQLDIETICPGHGPFVWNPRERIDENLDHRLDRELRILDALGEGAVTLDQVLDRAWSDTDIGAHPLLREAARLTLEAHLIKLRDEGRLPPGAPQPR
jgi:glyoxylase-like metal-dependent hydrolase (beta-lactamase superfamily II)